jgi:SsrA-binding protein
LTRKEYPIAADLARLRENALAERRCVSKTRGQTGTTMGARRGDRRIICENRRARHEYDLDDFTEAGLVLLGSEVKSLRAGTAHLDEAWVGFEGLKPILYKAHIAPFPQAGPFNHEPDRPRPLLMSAEQIAHFREVVREKGLTLVPLRLLLNGPWIKLEFAVGKGRKQHDKRNALREREDKREIAAAVRR